MPDKPSSQECPLCLELESPGETILGMLDGGLGRVLASSGGWALLPSLGALSEHHLMLMPLCHYRSISQAWDNLDNAAFTDILSAVQETFGNDDSLIFEHGEPEAGPLRSGACIDHAHLHIIPGWGHLIDGVARQVPFETTHSSLQEAMEKASRSGYHLAGRIGRNGAEIYLRPTFGPTPSQFLRRVVADAAGSSRLWDWRTNWNIASVQRTCQVWRASPYVKVSEARPRLSP